MPRTPRNTFNWRSPVEGKAPVAEPTLLPCGGYEVPSLARVLAAPHRTSFEARELADRFAKSATSYLPLALHFELPGVTDLRPTYGRLNVTP